MRFPRRRSGRNGKKAARPGRIGTEAGPSTTTISFKNLEDKFKKTLAFGFF
jgi:hypothetical protein